MIITWARPCVEQFSKYDHIPGPTLYAFAHWQVKSNNTSAHHSCPVEITITPKSILAGYLMDAQLYTFPQHLHLFTILSYIKGTYNHQAPDLFSCWISTKASVATLEKHFTLCCVIVVVEWHAIRKPSQAPHETVTQYVAASRGRDCHWNQTPTLEKATTRATQMEAAAYQAKKMTADTGAVVLVQAAQSKPHKTRQTALLSS